MTGHASVARRGGGTAVAALGQFSAALGFDDLPQDVVETAKVKVLDAVACALAARDTPTAQVALAYAEQRCRGRSPVLGSNLSLSATEATFVNAVLAHAIIHDDADPESGHPGCMIVPAVLSTAAERPTDGRTAIIAVVLGYEMMWRGGGCGAVMTGATARGIRGYIVNGAIGSAAAAAKVLALSSRQTAAALSCASNWSSGLMESIAAGSMEGAMMAGANSRDGVQAAFLAEHGMTGTPRILEGRQGFFRCIADIEEPPDITNGLGAEFRIGHSVSKLFPTGTANQAAVCVARVVRERLGADTGAITAIHTVQHPAFGAAHTAYPTVFSPGPYASLDAALASKPLAVATMLREGRCDIDALTAGMHDEATIELAAKVSSSGSTSLGPLQCEMHVELRDGSQFRVTFDGEDGNIFRPSLEEMGDRLASMCGRYVDAACLERVVDAVVGLDAGIAWSSCAPWPRAVPSSRS